MRRDKFFFFERLCGGWRRRVCKIHFLGAQHLVMKTRADQLNAAPLLIHDKSPMR
jgi:hypothetical protein